MFRRRSIAGALAKAVVTPVYSTWNPSDKDADISLSGGNLVASITANTGAIRGTQGRDATGNWYFEITVGGTSTHLPGIGRSSASLTNYPGQDANGWGRFSDGSASQRYNGGTGVNYGTNFGIPMVIGVHINNGTLVFYRNGVSEGTAYTGITGTLYPMWGPGTGAAGTRTATLNVGASAFTATLPSGASAWG